jgi:hypothetical protein
MKDNSHSNGLWHFLAAAEWVLILPAALFMVSLFLRSAQPPAYEPARTAGQLVNWYAAHPFLCLDIFLIALPFTVFVVGCMTAFRRWKSDAKLRQAAWTTLGAVREHFAALLIAAATLAAGSILAVVALHMITD